MDEFNRGFFGKEHSMSHEEYLEWLKELEQRFETSKVIEALYPRHRKETDLSLVSDNSYYRKSEIEPKEEEKNLHE